MHRKKRYSYCLEGEENRVQVKFLIDRGVSECFIKETLVEDNEIQWRKGQEEKNAVGISASQLRQFW